MDPSSPYWNLPWESQPDDPLPVISTRPATPDNSNAYFTLFRDLPLEIQILIWKHAAASRFAQCRKYDPLDYHTYYSAEKFCRVAHNHYASRPLSKYTPTRHWISNKLFRQLKDNEGRKFYGLLAVNKVARRSCLEFWKQSVEGHDVYRSASFWNLTEEQIRGAKERAGVCRERLVKVLGEMVGLMRGGGLEGVREGWA